MKKSVFCFLLLSFTLAGKAQEKLFSFSLSPGMIYYQGDLSGSAFPDLKTSHISLEADISYRFFDFFKLQFGFLHGQVSGNDSYVSGHETRNLHFKSSINDLRILTYFDIFESVQAIFPKKLLKQGEYSRKWIGPDIILGIGYMKMNPKGEYEGEWYALRELGTEGQLITGGDYPVPYKKWQFNVKYGIGFGMKLNEHLRLELEAIYSLTFTDYLDDVSGAYPNYESLLASENGELASYFTYGGRDGKKVKEGRLRGNPEANDGFMNIGLKFTYVIGRNQMEKLLKL